MSERTPRQRVSRSDRTATSRGVSNRRARPASRTRYWEVLQRRCSGRKLSRPARPATFISAIPSWCMPRRCIAAPRRVSWRRPRFPPPSRSNSSARMVVTARSRSRSDGRCGSKLAGEAHRRGVDILCARLGGGECWKRTGTLQDLDRLMVQHVVAGRLRHRAVDDFASAVQHEVHHDGAYLAVRSRRIALEFLQMTEHQCVVRVRAGFGELPDAIALRRGAGLGRGWLRDWFRFLNLLLGL